MALLDASRLYIIITISSTCCARDEEEDEGVLMLSVDDRNHQPMESSVAKSGV